jgi:phage gp36-like protein
MAYLTVQEYLDRFFEAETISLTDPAGVVVDEDKLATEIEGASNTADGYIGVRYSTPLDPVPDVVKDIVADLARERLFNLQPVEEVTKRADRARSMLKDISKGVMVLVAADELVAEDAADLPAVYAPQVVFTDSLMSSYKGRLQ